METVELRPSGEKTAALYPSVDHRPHSVDRTATSPLSKYRWGYPGCHPNCVQEKLNTGAFFLVLVSLVNMIAGAVTNGLLKVSLTSLERRYKLTSYDSGLIISMYDIAGCLSLLPISYFGGRGHKPRWCGAGLVVQGIGVLLFSFPHFMNGNYKYNSESFGGDEYFLCNSLMKDHNISEVCAKQNQPEADNLTNMKYMFMFSQFLNGLGNTPLTVLAITFMDENVSPTFYPFCIAVYFLSTLMGPAIGFSIGGWSLSQYVDMNVTPKDITPTDRVWVGRWWIGFLICGPLLIALAIPMLAFPAKLPERALRDLDTAPSLQPSSAANGGRADSISVSASLKSASRSMRSIAHKASHWDLWTVVTNWSFILLSISAALLSSIVAGYLSFGPKYVESAFGKTASEAALLYGIVCVPAASFGLIAGAMMMAYPRTTAKGAMYVLLIISFFTVFTHFAFLLDCGDTEFKGPTGQNGEYKDVCLDKCHCSKHIYEPVCGTDDVTYFSPCYAGCKQKHDIPERGDIDYSYFSEAESQKKLVSNDEAKKRSQFRNCSCLTHNNQTTNQPTNRTNSINNTAITGDCGEGKKCKYQEIILVCIFLMIFGMFFCAIPGVELSLNCFPEELRSLALGVQWMLIRTIGTIPGPVIFGILMDRSCIVWVSECPDDSLTCTQYSNYLLSTNLFTIPIIHKILSVIPFFILVFIYKTDLTKKSSATLSVPSHQQQLIGAPSGEDGISTTANDKEKPKSSLERGGLSLQESVNQI